MKTIYDELVEAGVVEMSEEELDKATGGFQTPEPYPDDFCF